LTSLRLRDRDAIITDTKMIFRVYGYSHPPGAYICDPEYTPVNIYRSKDPRAYRAKGNQVYYKFYTDEGLCFVQQKYPQHMIWYKPLQRSLIGVKKEQVIETRHANKTLQSLLKKKSTDILLQALQTLFSQLLQRLSLSTSDFGVFGSLLHNFYHPKFSDLDLIIYGREELNRLTETLNTLYKEHDSPLRNEFESAKSVEGKHWKFQNYSLREYVWHQRRKQVYALFHHKKSGRTIKTEFEPVKRWEEIQNEYDPDARIEQRGWIKLLARVTDDNDAQFMPSIYQVEPLEVLEGEHAHNIRRVVSYVEEFRLQAQKDELILVEGKLEQVDSPKQTYHQATLTYGARYYEQALKVIVSNTEAGR